LQVWADLERAPRTIDAYARGLAEYLLMCERDDIDPLLASRVDIAGFVRELTERPGRRGGNVVSIDSGSGLANATIQQRILVTWNLTVRVIISSSIDHELERSIGQRGGAGGEVAGAGSARTGGRLVEDMDRLGPCAPDDRRVRPRAGRVPADVRTGGR
jgi:hypothetical protein